MLTRNGGRRHLVLLRVVGKSQSRAAKPDVCFSQMHLVSWGSSLVFLDARGTFLLCKPGMDAGLYQVLSQSHLRYPLHFSSFVTMVTFINFQMLNFFFFTVRVAIIGHVVFI